MKILGLQMNDRAVLPKIVLYSSDDLSNIIFDLEESKEVRLVQLREDGRLAVYGNGTVDALISEIARICNLHFKIEPQYL